MTARTVLEGSLSVLLCSTCFVGCERAPGEPAHTVDLPPPAPVTEEPTGSAVESPAAREERSPEDVTVRVDTVPVPGDLPVFVLRGGRGNKRMVFLHGHCSHGLGYVQSFQRAAARHGTVVAVQGNKACANGSFREWTDTPERLDRRIESAFRAMGDPGPLTGLAVLGYSSGAVLAEMLAHKAPERYAYVVLIGGPKKPAEWRLRRTRSSVTLAGERDRQDLMQRGARDLHASGIPSAFFVLPGAKHGQMGPDAEPVMARALDWLWDNERSL